MERLPSWYSTVEAPTGGPTYSDRGYVLKLALGGDQGTTACTQPFPNSTGLFGSMGAYGSPIAARDNLTLIAENLPPHAFTLFLNSRTQGNVTCLASSQATLCLGGQINRYARPGELRQASPAGRASLQLDLATTPMGPLFLPVIAGETWYFQAWHRDPAGPGGLHLTDSISVVFN